MTYSVKRGSDPGTGELHTEMEVKYVDDDTKSGAKGGGKKVPTPVNLTNVSFNCHPRSPPLMKCAGRLRSNELARRFIIFTYCRSMSLA